MPNLSPFYPLPTRPSGVWDEATTGRWLDNVRERIVRQTINVKDFKAAGDGVTDDTAAFTAAIAYLAAHDGGTLWVPNGTYFKGKTAITSTGIHIECESMFGVIFDTRGSAAAGDYSFDVDITNSSRPFDFGLSNCSFIGTTTARSYSAIRLKGVYKPDVKNIFFQGIANCFTGDACYWGEMSNFWFEHYDVGIQGVTPEGCNSNTFTGMLYFEGNDSDDAIPIDGTYMNNNTFIGASFGSSASNGNAAVIAGNNNTFVSPRFESITSTGHWMTLGNLNKIINPSVSSQVAIASAKYVFDVTGHSNEIEVDGAGSNISRLVKCEAGSKYNKIRYKNVQPVGSQQPLLDFGKFNRWQIGESDWMVGNDNGGMCRSWSDVPITNLITRPMDFNDITLDGLTRTVQTALGPDNKGNVYLFDTPTGNRQFTQSIGTFGADTCFSMSVWAKLVSGAEETAVEMCLSESPSSDYAAVTLRSDVWTRVLITRKFPTGSFARLFAVRLPVSHGGVYLTGPQVVNLGSNAVSGELSPAIWGGYSPATYAPTITGVTNVGSAAASGLFQFMQVGNVVNVSGQITFDPTAANTASEFAISLPIPSALTADNQVAGTLASDSIVETMAVKGDSGNDRARVVGICGNTTASHETFVHFTYLVI